MNKYLETENWTEPNEKSMVKYIGQRNALAVVGEITTELNIHFADDIEYTSSSLEKKEDFPKGLLVAYVMKGGSEGHYVELTRIARDGEADRSILTVKTFSGTDKANDIANFLTKLYLQDITLTENEKRVA